MQDILQQIIAHKHTEVERQKQAIPLSTLLSMASERMERTPLSMRKALAQSPTGIIAEFKRKSPSKGWLHAHAQIADILPAYQASGASACSVLTDERFFGGAFADLAQARRLITIPILRKDFIIDEYQIHQSRALGADAILLIAATLTVETTRTLATLAHELNLEVLLEIHSASELSHLNDNIDMLGINNRHLGSFHTDVATSFQLVEHLKDRPTPLLISESGISSPTTVRELRQAGFRGFLIGETFMKTNQPGHALTTFISNLA
ncbi:MAG: indole-3-glycerol phosphate synthase TrpC [Tannerellaceae bacterium]|jgi:indole-3-glycerol phosphate synthase|nr:indole-3-glycerol phosphate synthase TrpC [Tannerellaceae bacterium]